MQIDLDDDEKRLFEENIAWLEANSPDDWHRVALDFNWGEPLYLLDWIVRQEQCDHATALTIFWTGQPAAWMEEKGSNQQTPDGYSYLNRHICAYVADRVETKGYERSEIAFKPTTWTKKDYVDLVALEQTRTHPNFRAGPELIRPREGRDVDVNADFYRRYPEECHLSYYDEQLSDELERGLHETQRSRDLTRRVDQVEQTTLDSFPAWLKEDSRVDSSLHPPTITEPTAAFRVEGHSFAEETSAIDSAAAARVRAVRRHADGEDSNTMNLDQESGVARWLKRLFNR